MSAVSNSPSGNSLLTQVWRGALVLVLSAFGARLVWELLKPLLPVALILLLLVAIFSLLRRPRSL